MKTLKRLVAVCLMLSMLSSCAVLKSVAQASTIGSSTGSALSTILSVLKATGGIDLSNLGNIINLGTILTGASTLSDATQDYTDGFAKGLISGSSNLVNANNVAKVMSRLKGLAKTDTSSILKAAATANSGGTPQLDKSSSGVSETLTALTAISKLVY